LNQILVKNQLYKGDDANTTDVFTDQQLELLRKEKALSISKKNPSSYKFGDDVNMIVEIKNIIEVQIDIFEINTLNYAQEKGRDYNNDIDLEGLVAKWSSSKKFDKKPIEQWEETFKFPELKERGVFVVQFVGNGLVSRAIINIGSLF